MDLYLLLHRTVMRYSGLYYTQRLPVLQAFDRQLDSLQHLCSAHIRGNALPLQTSLLSSSKAPYCSFRSRSGCRNLLRPHAHCYSFVVFLCISDDWKSEIQSGTVSSHYGSSYWMGNVDFRCLFACIIRNYLCEAQSPLKAIAPPSECSRRMWGNVISCLRVRFERFIASFERADAHSFAIDRRSVSDGEHHGTKRMATSDHGKSQSTWRPKALSQLPGSFPVKTSNGALTFLCRACEE